MLKSDIRSEFECQNRISKVKIRYSAPVRLFDWDFEYKNSLFGSNLNVKIGFRMPQSDI